MITHGEPHRGNVLVEADGARRLVDWDTTLVAPRERDLLFLLDDGLAGWEAYTSTAGAVELDREALDLYGRRWVLGDIGMFVAGVVRPHDEDENTDRVFRVPPRLPRASRPSVTARGPDRNGAWPRTSPGS